MLASSYSFSQSGQKWASGGNTITSGEFLGTNNNEHLIFKTNGIERMMIQNDGLIQIGGVLQLKSLISTDPGLVTYDNSGKLIPLKFNGNTNTVLLGDGTFGDIGGFGWKLDGNNLINTNTGFVGIGAIQPQAKLDVDGNTVIRGTLHVFDSIIVETKNTGDKVEVDTVKASKMEVTEDLKIKFDKTLLFMGRTIEKSPLCVKEKGTTTYVVLRWNGVLRFFRDMGWSKIGPSRNGNIWKLTSFGPNPDTPPC